MILLCLLSLSFGSELLKDRSVNVTMDGSWADTPLLAEAAAFIADANGEAYWTFINGLQKVEKIPETIADIRAYSLDYLSEELRGLMELALLTRAYSPRIEMFRQIMLKNVSDANTPIAIYGNKIYSTIEKLKEGIEERVRSRPVVYAFEPRRGEARDTIIFYSPMTHPQLHEWIEFLGSIEEELSFVYRPVGQTTKEPVKLRGYGFEMRPFNYTMTYSKEEDSKIERGEPFPDHPLIIEKKIVKGENTPNPLTLATQIIQFVKTANDPFKALVEVCENFPLYADNISRIPAAQSLRDKVMNKPEGLIAGASAIYVNNRLIRNPDIYHVLQGALDELRIAQLLTEHFGLSKESLNKSISLIPKKKAPRKFLIDHTAGSSFIYNMNDLEEGKAYQNWTRSLKGLYTNTPGRIGRNIYNAVFFIDPLCRSDMKLLLNIEEQMRMQAPIRFSYFVTPRNHSRVARRVINAWAHLRLRNGFKVSHQFLLECAKQLKDNDVKETIYRNAYQTIIKNHKGKKWLDLDSLIQDKQSHERKFLKRMRNFQDNLGVSSQGVLFNGRFYPGKRQDKHLADYMQNALPRLRMKLADHTLQNQSVETLKGILSGDDVFTRFNPLVQHSDKSPSEFAPLVTMSYYFQREFMHWTKSIKYNSTGASVKFATVWVFIGEDLARTPEAKHVGLETERWVKSMPGNASVAVFCDGRMGTLAPNAAPPNAAFDLLQLKPDEVTIVMNGRIIRMKDIVIYDWTAEDFDMLLKWENHRSVSMVQDFFKEDVAFNYDALQYDVDNIDASFHSQLALYLSFVYGFASHTGIVRFPIDRRIFVDNNPTVMNYDNPDSCLHFQVMLNPFEHLFQQLAPVVDFLRDTHAFDVKMYANFPTKDAHEYPDNLRSFHRFVLKEDDVFNFDRFDSDTVYSLMPHPPENWMVEPAGAPFDLDNFRPREVRPGVTVAKYRLSSVLVEGSALDEKYVPVHGLRIALDMGERGFHDSLSIKTMGYFQLKTQPGVWEVGLGEGPSQIVYNISSTTTLTVSSFVPDWMTMLVKHNEGMSRFSVYDLPKEYQKKEESDEVHIFAVVSGQLYEHLVKIMMVSAMRNTKSHITFWFLKNFVSHKFMEELPVFAEKYNFSYNFVEYHWPSWVMRQSERQRIIWGNKILFLDALFPMNLSRVIYIDSDAVVRGDLSRLMKENLMGCPYGFVPMGNSRKELEPYRFWKKGYWKNHLGKKKYHISAMFVIDLDRYRRMGAGDKLRKHYEKIVGNKKSLANLDQDLPNDAQDVVPIHSLKAPWLWCCTWCSDATKWKAQIIDLANNPKTKMSKVEMAKMYIEEWPLLDDEVKHFDNISYFADINLTSIRLAEKKQAEAEKAERKRRLNSPTDELDDETASDKTEKEDDEEVERPKKPTKPKTKKPKASNKKRESDGDDDL